MLVQIVIYENEEIVEVTQYQTEQLRDLVKYLDSIDLKQYIKQPFKDIEMVAYMDEDGAGQDFTHLLLEKRPVVGMKRLRLTNTDIEC